MVDTGQPPPTVAGADEPGQTLPPPPPPPHPSPDASADEEARFDADLLARSRRDPEVFGEFYARHVRAVLAYFATRTADPEAAADLTAETFAAAFSARARFRFTGAPPSAWLFGIARNLLARYRKRARIDTRARARLGMPTATELDDGSYERVEALVDSASIRAALDRAVARLSPQVAAAVQLRVVEELSYAEVAAELGCSEQAARVRVCRGLGELAETLAPSHLERPATVATTLIPEGPS